MRIQTMGMGTLAVCLLAAGSPIARGSVIGVQNVVTNLDANGDRQFISSGFVGSSTTFNASNIGNFTDGKLTTNGVTYGWNDLVPRDVSTSSNLYAGSPDRADFSTPYLNEAQGKGTIAEVFGGNNLSRIIDGEDSGSWKLELFFGPGFKLFSDGLSKTPELLIFERGCNSDIGIKGIVWNGSGYSYTTGLVVSRSQFTPAGWTLDTLEISGAQQVCGVGIDLSDLGNVSGGLVGVKLYAMSEFNGPDIVGVLSGQPVPEPATLALCAAGVTLLRPRRRPS